MDEVAFGEVALRVMIAALAGAAIGVERELGNQPAGLRTHILLSVGACLFTLSGVEFSNGDPSRIAAQVASGVGFLGAGVILRDQLRITGLTTAATVWVSAAAGVAAGAGAYRALAMVTVVSLVALVALKWVESNFLPRHRGERLALVLPRGVPVARVRSEVQRLFPSFKIERIQPVQGTGDHTVLGSVKLPPGYDLVAIVDQLRAIDGVAAVDLHD